MSEVFLLTGVRTPCKDGAMGNAYTSDGRRRSSMTHAIRGHQCAICPEYVFGNGGVVSHGRAHVRRGEAVELVKEWMYDMSPSRYFMAPDDPRVAEFEERGFEVRRSA